MAYHQARSAWKTTSDLCADKKARPREWDWTCMLVGKDPLEWMRRGEELKRVQNKKGKSSAVQYGMNRVLDIF